VTLYGRGYPLAALILTFALSLLALWPVSTARLHLLYPLKLYALEGIELREFRTTRGAYGSTRRLSDYPVELVDAVIEREDARFYWHPGFDPIAMLRALGSNLTRVKIRSGASTITQQLARTIYYDYMPANRYLRKAIEIFLAVRLEIFCSKSAILEAYLNQIAMPMNTSGLAAASSEIFKKDVNLLTKDEMRLLARVISQQYRALPSGRERTRHKLFSGAEHFTTWLSEMNVVGSGEIHTAMSAALSQAILGIISNEIKSIRNAGASQAAIIVLERIKERLELKAMVGSADFADPTGGEINHALRVRSAGSTLKPFIYGLGFDNGLFNAHTTFSDSELVLRTAEADQTYRPQNNDMQFWGNLTLRESLAASRNIPALKAADMIGLKHLLALLRRAGFKHLRKTADFYGAGLALGSGGATLFNLAHAYSALQNKGELSPIYLGTSGSESIFLGSRTQLFSESTAARITHIISDREIRRRAFGARNFLDFPFSVAVKSGTSKDYRDGWVVGYTPRYVVAAWVGNSRAEAMRSVSGAWGAGRIFHQAMRLVNQSARDQFSFPTVLEKIRICRLTGMRARPTCPQFTELAHRDEKSGLACTEKHKERDSANNLAAKSPRVISPAQGERYVLNHFDTRRRQEIPIIIERDQAEGFHYELTGSPRRSIDRDIREFVRLEPGDYTLKITGPGYADAIDFSVR